MKYIQVLENVVRVFILKNMVYMGVQVLAFQWNIPYKTYENFAGGVPVSKLKGLIP